MLTADGNEKADSSAHFETLSDGLKFVRLLTLQLRADFFKFLNDIR